MKDLSQKELRQIDGGNPLIIAAVVITVGILVYEKYGDDIKDLYNKYF